VGRWKCLKRGWEYFSKYMRYEVGNGSKVRFWHGLWCGEQALKFSFPKLFVIAHYKGAWVVDHMRF
jgi:hypothetical protein